MSWAEHIYRPDIVDAAIKQKPLKRGGGWRWICAARASETAAGANVGSHRNYNLITVLRISSCSGLKKMTRCSFWKSHSPCCLGNGADFHTAGVQGSPETVCVICTRRRRRLRQGNLVETWEAHSRPATEAWTTETSHGPCWTVVLPHKHTSLS